MDNPRGGNGCLYWLVACGVGMVVAGIALERAPDLHFLEEDEPPAPERGLVRDQGEPPPWAVEEAIAEPEPAPVEPTEPVSPAQTELVLWHAEVTGGEDIAAGTPCVLAVRMAHDLSGPSVRHAFVACGRRMLFDGEARASRVDEVSIGPLEQRYRMQVTSSAPVTEQSDALFARTGMHTIDIRHPGGGATLFVEDLSLPVHAPPAYAANEGRYSAVQRSVRLLAIPTRVSGAVPASVIAAQRAGREPAANAITCELTAGPAPSLGHNCRMMVRCGADILYGRDDSGYGDCTLRDDAILAAVDVSPSSADTDPRMTMMLDEGLLSVSDDGASPFDVGFELVEDPRCARVDSWQGAGRDREDTPIEWTVDGGLGEGSAPLVTWTRGADNAVQSSSATLDCRAGAVTIEVATAVRLEDRPSSYTLFFGPRFGSLAGSFAGDALSPGVLWSARRN